MSVKCKLILHPRNCTNSASPPTLTNLISFTCHWTEHVWVMARKLFPDKGMGKLSYTLEGWETILVSSKRKLKRKKKIQIKFLLRDLCKYRNSGLDFISIKMIKNLKFFIILVFVCHQVMRRERGGKKCQNINIYNFKQIFIEISIF